MVSLLMIKAEKWRLHIKDWALAWNQFEILCGDFKYNVQEHKN